jgi:integrase
MQIQRTRTSSASGNVYLLKGKRRDAWYMRYRLPDGTESRRLIGPAHKGGGRPPEGYFTKRTAQAALDAFLTDARRGLLPTAERTGASFSDAIDEWLRYTEAERGIRATTLREYTSAVNVHLRPAFGDRQVEDITTRDIERWTARLVTEGRLSRRTINKLLINLNGIFKRARRVWGVQSNPVVDVEKLRERYDPGDYDFYSPEEVRALVRAAENETDAALFLTAAFTGLRMGELLGLRWRDVDFEGEHLRVERQVNDVGELTPTKVGLVRSLPMVPDVAQALAWLSQRGWLVGEDDPVFPSAVSARRVNAVLDDVEWTDGQD